MLIKLIEIQQRNLDDLAQCRIKLNDKLFLEQRQMSQLQSYQKDLSGVSTMIHSLNMQNQQTMRSQVQNLIGYQQQRLSLTESDLKRQNKMIRQQIGQLKGIETVARRRQEKAEQAQELLEQFQNDELAIQAFLRNRSGE